MLAQTSVFVIIFFSLPSAFWAEGFLPQHSAIFGRGTFGRGGALLGRWGCYRCANTF